jgi:hypothetical protein
MSQPVLDFTYCVLYDEESLQDGDNNVLKKLLITLFLVVCSCNVAPVIALGFNHFEFPAIGHEASNNNRESLLVNINKEDALRIAIKIWYNECNGKVSGLTTWNEGEGFASLGIGHFIWRPNGSITNDGFPQLIKYMENMGITVPSWLQGEKVPACPWPSRTEFIQAKNTQRMKELRQFLVDTIPIQAQFMAHRLAKAFPKLLERAPLDDRGFIFEQFYALSNTPQGLYALVDYVNFKGEGIGWFAKQGSGWGLLQVIQGMKNAPTGMVPLQAFVWSANQALTARAAQTTNHSHEHRWLAGWRNRLYTYLE